MVTRKTHALEIRSTSAKENIVANCIREQFLMQQEFCDKRDLLNIAYTKKGHLPDESMYQFAFASSAVTIMHFR